MGGGANDCFLIDTSAAGRLPRLAASGDGGWRQEIREGRISICDATEAEIMYSARSVGQLKEMSEQVQSMYTWRTIPDHAWRRVKELQLHLAEAGCHRVAGVVDLLVAVTAQHHQLTVLHYDRDFDTIAKHTDLKTRWVAEPGSIP